LNERNQWQGEIFALSFHVDYWNRLGWNDPFSSAEFSERQRTYARTLSGGRVYTPQMVVQGKLEFVGSKRSDLDAALQKTLSTPSSVGVTLGARIVGHRLQIGAHARNTPKGATLVVAQLTPHAENPVPSGENAGRLLSHVNVVRNLRRAPRPNLAQVEFDRVEGANLVVAFVQDSSLAVLGANSLLVK
jgi:hypothetical protein